MVFHFEFIGYCPLFIWHGSNDFATYPAQRYCSLQSGNIFNKTLEYENLFFFKLLDWFWRGRTRRIWLEISSWRYFPPSAKGNVALSFCGIGCSSFHNDFDHTDICLSWISFTGKQGCADDLRTRSVRVLRYTSRICLITNLQIFRWRKVEIECSIDVNALSWVFNKNFINFSVHINNYANNLGRIVFGVFFILNLVLWSKGSSGAISFGILVALLALWFGISVPLTFVGAFFGFRKRVRFQKHYVYIYNLPLIVKNC